MMKNKDNRKGLQVVFGIHSGIVSEVFLFRDGKPAKKKYESLRKAYGISSSAERGDRDVQWFETRLIGRRRE